MTDHNRVSAWIDGYVKAWNSNDPEHIGDLFTEDAEYYTAPSTRRGAAATRSSPTGWSGRTSPARPPSSGRR
nr:hypothetical protein GCM10020093_033720 [Planobispora longispora]